MANFEDVKAEDFVMRMLAGSIPMKLRVEKIDDTLIYTYGGWMFDRKTGVEEDPDLQWGVTFGHTGSYLIK